MPYVIGINVGIQYLNKHVIFMLMTYSEMLAIALSIEITVNVDIFTQYIIPCSAIDARKYYLSDKIDYYRTHRINSQNARKFDGAEITLQ